MTLTTDLRKRIDAKRRQGLMLLSIESQDDTVNEHVRLGLRDLDEALDWLHRKPSTSPVHLLLELATWRLNTAMRMMRTEGAEAEAW